MREMPPAPALWMRRIAVILGSVRAESNAAKAMALVVDELNSLGVPDIDVINPRHLHLLIPGVAAEGEVKSLEAELQQRVRTADGVILITPEYDGSYSAVMKLLLEYLGYPSVLAGKPLAILGVASGRVGATRAVDHLRALALHIGAVVLPRPTSIAAVHKLFDAHGHCIDAVAAGAMRSVAKTLCEFARTYRP